jgi:hypothetical protein
MSDSSSGRARSSGRAGIPAARSGIQKNAQRDDVLASEGVLANLPRTRPQRSSARRDAARSTTAARAKSPKAKPLPAPAAKAKPLPAPAAKAKPLRTPARKQAAPKKRPPQARVAAKPPTDPAPRQGFETESDPISGSVQPPGGADLFASAAELAGELTKSGLSTGGRLLKDVLARLPLN